MPAELYSIREAAEAFGVPVSTLRYYDDIALVPASARRARVRCYDRAALARLAYVLLWRSDAMLSVERTMAIVSSADRDHRNELIGRSLADLDDRIARLTRARNTLERMTNCPDDDPVGCIVTGARIRREVDAALFSIGAEA
ncbi:MerR family transcriptional regulator [Amycolatopsis sp. lyj-23]|uniref:MerR family transcriptional regulator n=1 Tax=Amycolatopsis sp. lyj-23 TaxID=2789283 RepID=UPI00397BCC5A